MAMTSQRPYLVRAMYDWIVDNDATPHLMVDAEADGVQVPRDYVHDGKIVLNIAVSAVQDLVMDNNAISFRARFGGRPMAVRVPVGAIVAVYAKENGQGMMFAPEAEEAAAEPDEDQTPPSTPPPRRPSGPPSLKIVK